MSGLLRTLCVAYRPVGLCA